MYPMHHHPTPRLCKIFSLTAGKSHLLPMPQATWGTYPFPRQACEPRARPCAEYITVSRSGHRLHAMELPV